MGGSEAVTRRRIQVRAGGPDDEAFVLATVGRLADFDTPPWRTQREIWEGEARTLRDWFAGVAPGALLVAEADGAPAGFVFLERQTDYFTGEAHGHVGIIAVASEAEGMGAGRALLEAAERWARGQGDSRLTLNVFERNTRARRVYERLGFEVETLRYVKRLS